MLQGFLHGMCTCIHMIAQINELARWQSGVWFNFFIFIFCHIALSFFSLQYCSTQNNRLPGSLSKHIMKVGACTFFEVENKTSTKVESLIFFSFSCCNNMENTTKVGSQ